MKKIFCYILLAIFLAPIAGHTEPPGGGYNGWRFFFASFSVDDPGGNPVSGVNVELFIHIYGSEGDGITSLFGTTNSEGWVNLSTTLYYQGYEEGHVMSATLNDDRYTVISSSNTITTTSYNLYPDFEVILDADHDYIEDGLEAQIAEKFKPVLHKHSYDLQQGLADIQNYIVNGNFTLKVWIDTGEEAFNQQVSGSPSALHKWYIWHWDTYGRGSQSLGECYNTDLDNSIRYNSAPIGQRPLFYHVYKNEDGSHYFVQYWYYFGMNDIREQVEDTWHESDWEHISIQLNKYGDNFIPNKVNFYCHKGGKTSSAIFCWWSSTNSLSYSNIQQGYDETHTHLHIWIAANSHASYNRYSSVYHIQGRLFEFPVRTYKDRVDYEPSGNDLYFPYDCLIKLGEVTWQFNVKCPDSNYTLSFHSYPIGSSTKHWLAYRGRTGDYDGDPGAVPKSPYMPAKEDGLSHEWKSFTIGDPIFGNEDTDYIVVEGIITWVPDDGIGD